MLQVYNEAVKILYDENMFMVSYSRYQLNEPGLYYRVDDARNASVTSRQLRNGRSVDMISHKGLIYKDIFNRLRNVEFHVDLIDKTHMCDHMTMFWVTHFQTVLQSLYNTLSDCSSKNLGTISATNRKWTLVIHSVGLIGWYTLKFILQPLLLKAVAKAVHKGKLQMVFLKGKFPRNWDVLFREINGSHLSADQVHVVDNPDLDPQDLVNYFILEDLFSSDEADI